MARSPRSQLYWFRRNMKICVVCEKPIYKQKVRCFECLQDQARIKRERLAPMRLRPEQVSEIR